MPSRVGSGVLGPTRAFRTLSQPLNPEPTMKQLTLDFTKPQPDIRFRYRLELAEEAVIPYDEEVRLTRPAEVARFLFHRIFEREPREVFVVLFLDAQTNLIGHHIAYTGGLQHVTADPRQIFVTALLRNAASIVIAHNHPSGATEPSHGDRAATERLAEAGALLGISLVDHLIIGRDGRWTSLKPTSGL